MSENRVDKHMLIAPAETDGFAGAVAAFCVINGKQIQVAAASVYDTRVPRIRYAVPECVPYADFPELSRVLTEFANRVEAAVEQARR
ncbi:hypothetical protein G3A43_07875 [Paraburkholderia aspalathi]|nr:hypothetical protein [Paraburkholderia aspalathi]MBK3780174.1 hypothetical protein [Paraburkholderia aspalathi]